MRHEADIRYVGVLSGRYTLAAPGGGPDAVYACRTQSISPTVATLAAPVTGDVGQRTTLLIDHIGFIPAVIRSHISNGFQVEISANDEDRARLAARIDWLKRHRSRQVQDRRAAQRKLPRRPRAALYVGDDRHDCFIIDYSATGAGISSKSRPPLGTGVAVGDVKGIVVRHMDVGFAMKFTPALELQEVEAAMAKARTEQAA